MTPALALENPFPGLRPFHRGEEHLFFGRESQVDRMVDKLSKSRFLAVVGTSGTGKSSLVECGLIPALHRGAMARAGTSWCVVRCEPGGNPIQCMARAFAAEPQFAGVFPQTTMPLPEMVQATLDMSSLGLADLFQFAHFNPGTNLLVFVDQFEELFRYRNTQERAGPVDGMGGQAIAFVNLLIEAQAQTQFPIYVVLTMRSDFLGECSHFDRLPEVINEGQYLVPRLTREERRQAIAGPISVAGADLSPVLLTRLVNDVGENPDQLSIMQHAVYRTWAFWQAQQEESLNLADYENEKVGTMARALDLHAEEAYAMLETARARMLCERIFKALTDKATDPRGIRRPLPLHRLCRIVDAGPAEVGPILDIFREPSRSFLMPPIAEALEPGTVIDITHEILMRVWLRLKEWANEEAQSAAFYRHLAETAELHDLGKAGLWGDPDLRTSLEWKARQQPNPDWAALYHPRYETALNFLEQSRQIRDSLLAEKEFLRRWRRITPAFMLLAFIAFLLISPSISQMLAPRVRPVFIDISERPLDAAAPPGTARHEGRSWFARYFAYGFGYQLSAVICILGYVGVSTAGKRLYRAYAYDAILDRISNPLPVEPAPILGAIPDSVLARTVLESSFNSRAPDSKPVPAAYWRILLAGLVDFITYLVLAYASLIAVIILGSSFQAVDHNFFVIFLCWLPALACLYPAVMTRSRLGGTLGDLIAGIRLTDLSGRKPSFARVFARYAASILSWTILGLGFFLQLVEPRRQSLHDQIAGTFVGRRQARPKLPAPSLLKIAT